MKNIKAFLSIVVILSIFCNALALTPNSYIQEETECAETGKSEQEKNDDLLVEAAINNDINTLNKIFISKIFSAKAKNEAFFLALVMGNAEAVKLLIDSGINVNMDFLKAKVGNGNPFFASTPVMAAVALGHSEILSILIKKGAKVNVKNEDGYKPADMLVLAKYYNPSNYNSISSLLTKAGATFSKKKNELQERFQSQLDKTLDKAKELLSITSNNTYNLNAIKLLIDSGANVNAKDEFGRTPLISCFSEFSGSDDYFFVFSALYGCRNIVKLLIDSGADVNQQDDEGKTALIYAITIFDDDLGYTAPIIKDLLNAGADINLKDKRGKSALDYASYSESPYVRELFGLSAELDESEDSE